MSRRLGLFLSIALAFSSTGCEYFSAGSLKSKVVVDVNGEKLTAAEFSKKLAASLRDQDALSAKDPRTLELHKKKIVEDFIVRVLSEEWARENDILVKAEELDEEIRKIQGSYPTDLAFQEALAEEGLTFKEWKSRLQETLLQKAVALKASENVTPPTDQEMQTYFREHQNDFIIRESAQIRQILVSTESDAKAIETELKKGKRLPELAKKYSISPEGPQGGMVGWVEKGLTDVFESAFRMKQGQRSPIVKSSFGYHIFEVLGRKPSRNQSFNDVKGDIKRILMEKKTQGLYLSWLEERVRKSRVFKDQDFIDAIKVETKVR